MSEIGVTEPPASKVYSVVVARHQMPVHVGLRRRLLVCIVHKARPIEHRGPKHRSIYVFGSLYECEKIEHLLLRDLGEVAARSFEQQNCTSQVCLVFIEYHFPVRSFRKWRVVRGRIHVTRIAYTPVIATLVFHDAEA